MAVRDALRNKGGWPLHQDVFCISEGQQGKYYVIERHQCPYAKTDAYDSYRRHEGNKCKRYKDKDRIEEAVKSFEKAIKINKNLPEAHEELGMIYYRKLKDNDKALYHFERLLSLNPGHPDAESINDIIRLLKSR